MKTNKFNFEAVHTWWIAEHNMVIFNGNVMHQCDNGKRDSLGRTFEAFVAYEDERFLIGMLSCFTKKNGKWYGKRFPVHYETEVPISRDHVYNMTFALYHAAYNLQWKRYESIYLDFIANQPYKLSSFANQSIIMMLWYNLLQDKFIGKLYYPMQLLELKIYKVWNKAIYNLTGVGELGYEEHQDNFHPILTFPRAKILDRLASMLFPNYALMYVVNRNIYSPYSKNKVKVQKALHPLIPKYNYVAKILSNHPDKVTKDMVDNYKPMVGDRWHDILNPWINWGRNVCILDKNWLGENELDKDYLLKIFNNYN